MVDNDNKEKQMAESKYDQAVTKAQSKGHEVAKVPSAMAPFLTQGLTEEQMAKELAEPGIEWAPQQYSLKEGEMVRGILEGNGPIAEFVRDGIINEVNTWIISSFDGSKRVSILSSVQLDKKCAPFVGGPIKIVRGKDVNIGDGKRMTEYLVGGEKLPNNQRRVWADRPSIETTAIDVKQLPEGQPTPHGNHAAPTHA